MPVTEKGYAKINLTLSVLEKRNDGYHDIRTVMQTVDLYDTVTVEERPEGIALTLSDPALPTDDRNTAYAAAREFLAERDVPLRGVSIAVEKRIPQQAGLAGGSADAAAVLHAMNRLSGGRFTTEELCQIGVRVGADVPFCVACGAALCTGIGERMQPLPSLPEGTFIVVAKPPVGVSTKEAYASVDTAKQPHFEAKEQALCRALLQGEPAGVGHNLYNHFETALALPEVIRLRREMERFSPLGSCMSGSGSSVFALFAAADEAQQCADALSCLGEIFVCRPIARQGG